MLWIHLTLRNDVKMLVATNREPRLNSQRRKLSLGYVLAGELRSAVIWSVVDDVMYQ